jgi:organic radical activating enzyme
MSTNILDGVNRIIDSSIKSKGEHDAFLEKVYPIAEIFIAPQGEAKHTGTLMTFVRLAGCTVGKPFLDLTAARKLPNYDYRNGLKIYQEQCHTYDNRSFVCDTNFKMSAKMTVAEIIAECTKDYAPRYVCLTGGEPLMHELLPLLTMMRSRGLIVHVETSGTILVEKHNHVWHLISWLTVSPKLGFLDEYAVRGIANEFKLLVDENFDWNKVPASIKANGLGKIWLQPVNYENEIIPRHVDICKALQLKHPSVRISLQAHKLWHSR